jgi:hypothetical protein
LKKKYKKKSKGKDPIGIATKLVTMTAVIVCLSSIIINKSNHADMQKEIEMINRKAEEIESENIEMRRILEDNDIDAYMEKLAIEKMNYAYPNERRYYDKSRN